MAASLLVELLVEELPPKALKRLGEAFANGLAASLRAQGLASSESVATPFASPRRLAMHLTAVAGKAVDRSVRHKLMPVTVALDASGQPTPALLKRLHGLNLGAEVVPALARRIDGKVESLFADLVLPGASLDEGLQKALDETLAELPIPKLMSYQLEDGWTSVRFVRPAHGLVALHGEAVVRSAALGLRAGRDTQGHRFEAAQSPLVLQDADSYAAQLRDDGAVIASFTERRLALVRQLQDAAARAGGMPVDDDALLDEVTALVERPNVLIGQFEPRFLEVPQECLILTMKANQKYFPLLDASGRLSNRFLITSNISPADPGNVISGNERVVQARLADAKFFFDQDRKKTLESRVPGLATVVYHGKLGSQGERVERVRAIARTIGRQLGGEVLAAQADRAARLAKADLLTDMVGEFPELQGVMGGYYARHDGEPEAVALAIEDHYKPRFAGDELPRNAVGVAVALADKAETLVGLFGIGQAPSGDKDPFALRRHALGLIRILIERELPLELGALLGTALAAFRTLPPGTLEPLRAFVDERLAGSLREQGFSAHEVDAVLALAPQRLDEVKRRLLAVRAFAALPEALALAAANKRVANILKKADAACEARVDPARLVEPAEAALHEALRAVEPIADAAFERGDYGASLSALAGLKSAIDAFFERVLVNAEDAALRANRLGLLATMHAAMNRVADLSKLAR